MEQAERLTSLSSAVGGIRVGERLFVQKRRDDGVELGIHHVESFEVRCHRLAGGDTARLNQSRKRHRVQPPEIIRHIVLHAR